MFDLTELRTAVKGRVLLKGDDDFEIARRPYNLAVSQPVDAVVEVGDKAGDRTLEVDVVLPQGVIGVDEQSLVSGALLRLMDAAQLQPTAQPDRFRITFDSDGRKAVLELNASSVVNPFRRGLLDQFRCPDRL